MAWVKRDGQEAVLAGVPMQLIQNTGKGWLTAAPDVSLQIAHHVLGQHRYRQPGDDGLSTMTDAQDRWAASCTQGAAVLQRISRAHQLMLGTPQTPPFLSETQRCLPVAAFDNCRCCCKSLCRLPKQMHECAAVVMCCVFCCHGVACQAPDVTHTPSL